MQALSLDPFKRLEAGAFVWPPVRYGVVTLTGARLLVALEVW
jgi:hypothetical protein